jgi:aspartate aminotransferase
MAPISKRVQVSMELLAAQDVFCLPGAIIEMPGYFRPSLTADDEMIERALPGFEKAMKAAKPHQGLHDG